MSSNIGQLHPEEMIVVFNQFQSTLRVSMMHEIMINAKKATH
jgi:hypothetical protein